MQLLSAFLLALTAGLGFVSGAPAQARRAVNNFSERQDCPWGHVVTLWVEQGTEIMPKGTNIALPGGAGQHYDFGFEAGKYTEESFLLQTRMDGADVNAQPTNKFICTIHAPDGVPGDCFEISVRHAWPYISGGRDTLTSACVEFALDAPVIL